MSSQRLWGRLLGVRRGLPGIGVVGRERVGVLGDSRFPATERREDMDDFALIRGLASTVIAALYFFTTGPLFEGVCARETLGCLTDEFLFAFSSACVSGRLGVNGICESRDEGRMACYANKVFSAIKI